MIDSSAADESGCVPLSDGGLIAYQIHGAKHAGVPVFLIRPLGGTMLLWGEFRDVLARELRVISFDLRGSGHSSSDPAWPSTQGLARDSIQVLAHLAVPRAHIFGISLGGMTATWLALLAPDRVATLCLASTPACGLELSRAGLRRELRLAACFARAPGDVEAKLVERILSRRFREAHPEQVRAIERAVRAEPASRAALLKHALAGLRHDARRELGRIQAPTLVLAGECDTLLGTGAARALAHGIPHAKFEIIADSGHDLSLEQPLVSAQRVAEFVRTTKGTASG